VLHVFGGKITTYRRLAESALARRSRGDGAAARGTWTAGAPLPGGDFPHDTVQALIVRTDRAFPFLMRRWAQRLVRAYGTEARA
jgi:glycerol-3-phosphate dehydrogenase